MSLQFLSDKQSLSSQSSTSPIISVCWTPPSTSSQGFIFTGDCNGNIKVFDAQSALAYHDLPKTHNTAVHCLSADNKGKKLLSSAIDGSITLWNVEPFYASPPTLALESEVSGEGGEDGEPTLLPLPVVDAELLISAKLNSINEQCEGEAWKTHLHPDLALFASSGAGAITRLHSTDSFGKLLDQASPPSYLAQEKDVFGTSISLSPTNLLAIGTNQGHVLLHTLHQSHNHPELRFISVISDHPSPIRSLSFTPHLLLAGSDDRTISVHDVKPIQDFHKENLTGASTVASLTGHKGWIWAVQPVPTAEGVVASIAADKTIKFWDLASTTKNTPVWNASEVAQIRAFAFQPLPKQNKEGEVGERGMVGGGMTRFVTASEDGRLRWYRGAGLG